jgi:hypothetical protein
MKMGIKSGMARQKLTFHAQNIMNYTANTGCWCGTPKGGTLQNWVSSEKW